MTTFGIRNLAKAAVPALLVMAFASTPVSASTVSADKTAASTVTQYDLTAKTSNAQAQADKAARKAAKQAAKKAKKCAKWKSKMHRSAKARGKYNASCVSAPAPTETGTGGTTGGGTSGTDGDEDTTSSGGTTGGSGGTSGSAGGTSGSNGPTSFSPEVPTQQLEEPTGQVPEPGTLALLGLGLMGLGMTRRKAK